MSGYIRTKTGAQAMDLLELDIVRYAAKMDDGTGFVAYDGDLEVLFVDDLQLMEPIPEYPDTWPKRIAPKRGVSNGQERFAIVSDLLADDIMRDPYSSNHVTGVVVLSDSTVLIETDGFKVPMAIWSASSVVIADKRLLVAT